VRSSLLSVLPRDDRLLTLDRPDWHRSYYTCWLETTAPPPDALAASASHQSTAMTSSVSSLTDVSSVNHSHAHSPSTTAPSPFLGFDGFKFEPDDADFLSVRGGQQSRSLSFPRIHFGDDEDDEDNTSDDDASESETQSDSTRGTDDSGTEEERSRLARLKSRRKSSDRKGRLLRKVIGQREREESTDFEHSGLSAIGWGSRVLYIQMVRGKRS
jgi:hypothetical protein